MTCMSLITGETCGVCHKKIRWWQNGCMASPRGDSKLHYYHNKCYEILLRRIKNE